jgi:hypothetical protein
MADDMTFDTTVVICEETIVTCARTVVNCGATSVMSVSTKFAVTVATSGQIFAIFGRIAVTCGTIVGIGAVEPEQLKKGLLFREVFSFGTKVLRVA